MNSLEVNESKQDFFIPDEQKIRRLQTILQAKSGNPVSFEEAEEIGIQLIALYECLARDREITIGQGNR